MWSLMDLTEAPGRPSPWGILLFSCIQDLRWEMKKRYSFGKMFGLALFLLCDLFPRLYRLTHDHNISIKSKMVFGSSPSSWNAN